MKFFLVITLILFGLSSPVIANEDTDIVDFVQKAAPEIMSFTFADFDEKKVQNKSFFSESGYQNFYIAMDRSRIPEAVKAEKIMYTSKMACAPEIMQQYEKDGLKAWDVNFSLDVEMVKPPSFNKSIHNVKLVVVEDGGKHVIHQWVVFSTASKAEEICGIVQQNKAKISELRRIIEQSENEIKKLEAEISQKPSIH